MCYLASVQWVQALAPSLSMEIRRLLQCGLLVKDHGEQRIIKNCKAGLLGQLLSLLVRMLVRRLVEKKPCSS